MKFLCFPGAGSNVQTFKSILAPFMTEMESDNSMSFVFTQGDVPCQIPVKFLAHYGAPPHLQFIARKEYIQDLTARFAAVERAIENATPEEKIRLFLRNLQPLEGSLERALERVFRVIDEEGPFDGVLGHSEGTAMAATVLLEEKRRFHTMGRPKQFRYAIFFNGFPPLVPGKNQYLLADDKERIGIPDQDCSIDIPSLHVLGSLDPWVCGSLALYNVCAADKAALFDHGGGHSVPRDSRTIKELGAAVRKMMWG